MNEYDVLEQARNKIADPKNWTKRAYARDTAGNKLMGDSPRAVSWCAVGALISVAGNKDSSLRAHILLDQKAAEVFDGNGIMYLNDELGHKNVLDVFDKALADRPMND